MTIYAEAFKRFGINEITANFEFGKVMEHVHSMVNVVALRNLVERYIEICRAVFGTRIISLRNYYNGLLNFMPGNGNKYLSNNKGRDMSINYNNITHLLNGYSYGSNRLIT